MMCTRLGVSKGQLLGILAALAGASGLAACAGDSPKRSGDAGDRGGEGSSGDGDGGGEGSSGQGDGGGGGASGGDSNGSGPVTQDGPKGAEGLAGTREEFCSGAGTAVGVGGVDGSVNQCLGGLAEKHFRYALCTCERSRIDAFFRADGFDSTDGAYEPATGGFGGAVGINGPYCASGNTEIKGPVIVAAKRADGKPWLCPTDPASAAEMTDGQDIHGTFRAGGALHSSAVVRMRGDAWVQGDVLADDEVRIDGKLYQPADGERSGSLTATLGTEEVPGGFTVPAPCDCNPDVLLDVESIVAWGKQNNDNAFETPAISPTALINPPDNTVINLTCGRYYFTGIANSNNLTIKLSGRAALFIDGNFNNAGNFKVELTSPTAEIDMFVKGNVEISGSTSYGASERPAGARMYVAGSVVRFTAASNFVGNIYAPKALVEATDTLHVYGSVFGREFLTSSHTEIHFDKAVLRAGDTCDVPPGGGTGTDAGTAPPPVTCGSCGDCRSHQACIGGTCGACSTSADCCAPLECNVTSGRCESFPTLI